MGILDNLGGQDKMMDMAKEQMREHDDQIDAGIDRAGDMAGQKLGHDEQIDQGLEMAKGRLDDFTGADESAAADNVAEGDPTTNA